MYGKKIKLVRNFILIVDTLSAVNYNAKYRLLYYNLTV